MSVHLQKGMIIANTIESLCGRLIIRCKFPGHMSVAVCMSVVSNLLVES